jgi:hypothetical protein
MMRRAGHVARMGRDEVHASFYVGRKRLLGRPKRKWEDIIKMNLQEVV